MFASALIVEREPVTWADLPGSVMHWTQTVGALALLGLILWLLLGLPFMRRAERQRIPPWESNFFLISIILSVIFYVFFGIAAVAVYSHVGGSSAVLWRNVFSTAGGACALLAACLPILRNMAKIRLRRVWALARLSFQEALRKKLLYAFSALLLFFLFASWFLSAKPEEQVRAYVGSVFIVMTFFLLIIAAVIASFSIPTDIKQQTIHTVVTKPVERFEIVLGRFLGYTGIMTLVLLFMSTICVLYVVRGVDPDAAAESLKAREALYGDLTFENTSKKDRGDSVGREFDYRSYIAAELPGKPVQYAIWSFPKVPSDLANRREVPCELTFDIYRTTKGDENAGISCAFVFTTWRFKKGDEDAYRAKRHKERAKTDNRKSDADIDNDLAEEFGYYEVPSKNITDYHTETLSIPGGLFKNATKHENGDDALKSEMTKRGQSTAAIQVRVKCTSPTQYIGMAKYDLYLRGDDPSGKYDRLWFAWNFYKAAFGLWLRLCLVTGLAVVLSTYLSGVISLLITKILYLLGLFVAFIQEVGAGKNVGGGPLEGAFRLARRDNLVTPLADTTPNLIAKYFDNVYRQFLQVVLNVIPDVFTSNLVTYVESGFNIGPERLVVAALQMAGYLLPWFLLGYYMIKWREIASGN
jgi:ABC-type transport system involved in multi-copper enzyme maturation permease subunit